LNISQKIIDYAIWYYLKYYPSPKKLAQKLNMKFWLKSDKGKKYWGIDDKVINYIINEKLKNIIQEKEVIKWKIIAYKWRWKSKFYIQQKLYQRQEKPELIKKYLNEYFKNWDFENCLNEYNKINKDLPKEKIIKKLINKWFSYNDIKKLTIS